MKIMTSISQKELAFYREINLKKLRKEEILWEDKKLKQV